MLSLLIIFFGSGKSGKDDDDDGVHHHTTKPKVTLMEMIFLVLLFWYNSPPAQLSTLKMYSLLRSRMRLDDDAVVCLVFKNAEERGGSTVVENDP